MHAQVSGPTAVALSTRPWPPPPTSMVMRWVRLIPVLSLLLAQHPHPCAGWGVHSDPLSVSIHVSIDGATAAGGSENNETLRVVEAMQPDVISGASMRRLLQINTAAALIDSGIVVGHPIFMQYRTYGVTVAVVGCFGKSASKRSATQAA